MKQLTSYNRVAGYLNKIFDLLNAEFFESELSRPTITIQSTPRSYGYFSLRNDTWLSKNGPSHEINIGAGTLSRPIEEVTATLLHEMVHYHNFVNGIQDCSRGNTYHNRRFRDAAEARGLIITHSEKYGWSHTAPGDELLEVILKHDLTDILLNRNEYSGFQMPDKLDKDTPLKVSVTVKNTGKVAGDEVVQLYMHDELASVARPLKELVAFKRVTLNPGESKTVELEVPYRSFHMWDKDMNFVVEEGWFEVWLGKDAENVIDGSRVYVR